MKPHRGPAVVEVFADVTCPFTHVGLLRLRERRDELGSDTRIRIKAWPLELVNGEAPTGDFVAEEVTALRSSVAPEMFAGLSPAQFPTTTLLALGLTALAYSRSLELGERVGFGLRDALFERGEDVGDPAVVATIARAHELDVTEIDPGAILAEYDEGRHRGVVGSPYFIVDGIGYFCPALDIRRVDGHLEIRTDPVGFDAFVDAALSDQKNG